MFSHLQISNLQHFSYPKHPFFMAPSLQVVFDGVPSVVGSQALAHAVCPMYGEARIRITIK